MSSTTADRKPKWQIYGSYVLMALLTLGVGVVGGVSKFVNNTMWVERFNNFGYPLWSMYAAGLIEVAAVVALWFPRTRVWGAIAIVVTMIGAVITNVRVGDPVAGNLVFIVASALVLWIYRDNLRSLLSRPPPV